MTATRSAAALRIVPAVSPKTGIDAYLLDATSAAQILDATLLSQTATRDEVTRFCEEARQLHVRAVCIDPSSVPLAVAKLRGSGVKVCTVVGFPFGSTLTTVKRFEAAEALRVGAAELEMVLNIGALRSGDSDFVRADIRAVADICHSAGGVLKVIIDTGLLTQKEKPLACDLALAAGADFLQTAATVPNLPSIEDVSLMRRIAGDRMGVKAAGAIRTPEQLRALVAAGATRVGTTEAAALLAGFNA